MKFNVTFMGPEPIAHLRRDLMLLLQYALEDLGHTVTLSTHYIEPGWVNIVIGGYFLRPDQMQQVAATGAQIIHLNSEIICNDMMNFNPQKVDFLGAYLPFLRTGLGVMETVIDNQSELTRYGLNHHFLRWAYHERLEDIRHQQEKDMDFYLFGMMSERRQNMLRRLYARGFTGIAHHSCPYYVRNSYIARARIQLNIIQDDVYTHVNCYRIGYLMNNRCAVLSEHENDPAGFLTHAKLCTQADFEDVFAGLLASDNWKKLADSSYDAYKKIHITPLMESALEHFLGRQKEAALASA